MIWVGDLAVWFSSWHWHGDLMDWVIALVQIGVISGLAWGLVRWWRDQANVNR